jgi:hypothetical protein
VNPIPEYEHPQPFSIHPHGSFSDYDDLSLGVLGRRFLVADVHQIQFACESIPAVKEAILMPLLCSDLLNLHISIISILITFKLW